MWLSFVAKRLRAVPTFRYASNSAFLKNYLQTFLKLACLLLLISGCQAEKPKPLKLGLGQNMPILALQTLDGKPASLNFESEKITLLNIWATWCGPCRHEMPSLQRLADQLNPKRFQVIGISVDKDNHVAREYLIDKKIRFKNFINPDMSIANEIAGIRVYPTTYIIDQKGQIRHVEEGWRYWDQPDIVKTITDIAKSSR